MKISITLVLALAFFAAPCLAQAVQIGPDRYAVTLRRADVGSEIPAAARRTLSRIEAAAMAVCGAPESSLSVVRNAVRRSSCWRESVAKAVDGINKPLLLQAWHDHR